MKMLIYPFRLKFSLGFLMLSFLMLSCQEKQVFSLSENDLKMVDVLIDIYTVDAAIREYTDLDLKDSLKRAYFEQVYELHGINEEWLQTERVRLESEPIRMDSVYTRALTRLEAIKKVAKEK